jgi:hypothetical protein
VRALAERLSAGHRFPVRATVADVETCRRPGADRLEWTHRARPDGLLGAPRGLKLPDSPGVAYLAGVRSKSSRNAAVCPSLISSNVDRSSARIALPHEHLEGRRA